MIFDKINIISYEYLSNKVDSIESNYFFIFLHYHYYFLLLIEQFEKLFGAGNSLSFRKFSSAKKKCANEDYKFFLVVLNLSLR